MNEEDREFAYMSYGFCVNDNVYMLAKHHLFRLSADETKVWHSDEEFWYGNTVNGMAIVQKRNVGLFTLKGEALEFLVEFTPRLRGLIPLDEERTLLVSQDAGLLYRPPDIPFLALSIPVRR